MTINWDTFSAVVLFLVAIIGFYWKLSDRRQKQQQAQADKRNQALIRTIKEVNEPHFKRLEILEDESIDLKELANRSFKLHEQHEQNFHNLDRRVLILEKTPNGVHTKLGYKEIYESEEI